MATGLQTPEEYLRIVPGILTPDKRITFSLFAWIAKHFQPYLMSNQMFERSHFADLTFKGVTYLYIHRKDLDSYHEYLFQNLDFVDRNQGLNLDEKVQSLLSGIFYFSSELYKNPKSELLIQGMRVSGSKICSLLEKSPHTLGQFALKKRLPSNLNHHLNDLRTTYFTRHALQVSALSTGFANFLHAFDNETIFEISVAGALHDIGMALIPEVFEKPEGLTVSEWEMVKKHPEQGCEILDAVEITSPLIKKIIQTHHYRADGTGYPQNFSDDGETPSDSLASEVVAFCDCYTAMTSNRPFDVAMQAYPALQQMKDIFGHHHPELYKGFILFIRDI